MILYINSLEQIVPKLTRAFKKLLPKKLGNKLTYQLSLFEHLEKLSQHTDEDIKVCICPFWQRMQKLRSYKKNTTGDLNIGALYKDEKFPLYIFDERKMDKGHETGILIPGRVVLKTIEVL